jgi:hypothetical protein
VVDPVARFDLNGSTSSLNRRGARIRRALIGSALTALLVLVPGTMAAASAATVHVRDSRGFADAVARMRVAGGRIVLRGARYEELVIGPRGAARLTIRGTPGASVGRVRLLRSRSVKFVGLRMRPRWRDAGFEIVRSRGIWIERTVVTAFGTRLTANVRLLRSRGVTISHSRFSHCGEVGPCILTGGSSGLRILGNRFHDCLGCDFVRGRFRRNVLIRSNRFERSLNGRCVSRNPHVCGHQDLVEFHAGKGLVVERNRFGVYQFPGGGQLSLFGPVDNVMIRNNVFLRWDPRAPRVSPPVAINLGGYVGLPTRVVIEHNTILSGRRHPRRSFATSVRLKATYRFIPPLLRPVLANNVIHLAATPRLLCQDARLSVANVIEKGGACSPSDVVGDARLDRRGRPTATSALTIDRASAPWATRYDVRGFRRDARPDIGAYEYGARRTTG